MNAINVNGLSLRASTNADSLAVAEARWGEGAVGTTEVLLIDPDAARRSVVSEWLNFSGFEVRTCENLSEFLRDVLPDTMLVIADTDGNVSSLMGHLQARRIEQLPVIAYAEIAVVRQIVQAMRKGATGYFQWPLDKVDMIEAIHAASNGIRRIEIKQDSQFPGDELPVINALPKGPPLTETARPSLINVEGSLSDGPVSTTPGVADEGKFEREIASRALLRQLSNREMEILMYVARGTPSKIIAETLDISPRTVEVHRCNILRKMNVKNFYGVIRIARESNIF